MHTPTGNPTIPATTHLAGGMLTPTVTATATHPPHTPHTPHTPHAAVVWRQDGAAAMLHLDASCCITTTTTVPAHPTSRTPHHVTWTCLPATPASDGTTSAPRIVRVTAHTHVHGVCWGESGADEAWGSAEAPADTSMEVVGQQGAVAWQSRFSDAWRRDQGTLAVPADAMDVTTALAVGYGAAPTLLVQVRRG